MFHGKTKLCITQMRLMGDSKTENVQFRISYIVLYINIKDHCKLFFCVCMLVERDMNERDKQRIYK